MHPQDPDRDKINESLCLSPSEVKELTGYTHVRAQIRALVLMGIGFAVRPNGTPAVFRSSLSVFDIHEERQAAKEIRPRFDRI